MFLLCQFSRLGESSLSSYQDLRYEEMNDTVQGFSVSNTYVQVFPIAGTDGGRKKRYTP